MLPSLIIFFLIFRILLCPHILYGVFVCVFFFHFLRYSFLLSCSSLVVCLCVCLSFLFSTFAIRDRNQTSGCFSSVSWLKWRCPPAVKIILSMCHWVWIKPIFFHVFWHYRATVCATDGALLTVRSRCHRCLRQVLQEIRILIAAIQRISEQIASDVCTQQLFQLKDRITFSVADIRTYHFNKLFFFFGCKQCASAVDFVRFCCCCLFYKSTLQELSLFAK